MMGHRCVDGCGGTLDAIEVRQAEIEHDQLWFLYGQEAQCVEPVPAMTTFSPRASSVLRRTTCCPRSSSTISASSVSSAVWSENSTRLLRRVRHRQRCYPVCFDDCPAHGQSDAFDSVAPDGWKNVKARSFAAGVNPDRYR
jgi:hypothetical protein